MVGSVFLELAVIFESLFREYLNTLKKEEIF